MNISAIKSNEYKLPVIFAVILHLTVIIFLLFNLNMQTSLPSPTSGMNIIHAVAVSQDALKAQQAQLLAQQQEKQLAAQQAQEDLEKQQQAALRAQQLQQQHAEQLQQAEQQELVRQQQAAQLKIAEQQAAQQKIIKQKQAQQQAAQQQIIQQQQAVAQQQAQEKAAQLKAAAAALKKQQLAKKQADALKLQQQLQQNLAQNMQQELASDQSQLDANAKSQQIASELDKYKSLIRQAISQQWLVPDNLAKDLSCKLLIRLAPGGVVLDVQLVESSGNPALDHSAIAAVYKASPLPVPTDPDAFDQLREVNLTVQPDGNG